MALFNDPKQYVSHSPEETMKIGEKIGQQLKSGDILSLEGTLGSGKTTLVKGVAHALEIKELVTSPTFTIMSVYDGRLKLYHIDLYRLNDPSELDYLGLSDMMYQDGVSLIEWGEKALDELPTDTVRIKLSINQDGSRTIDITSLQDNAQKEEHA
jgi:tRNA threonylcarbamoyladenosine biosynthesis protein TsaE